MHEATPFNKRGRAIKNQVAFLKTVIAGTLYKTARWFMNAAKNMTSFTDRFVKDTVNWITKNLQQSRQLRVLAGLEAPTYPYLPKEQWSPLDHLTEAEEMVKWAGSSFDYTVSKMKELLGHNSELATEGLVHEYKPCF